MAVTPIKAPSARLVKQSLILFDLVVAGPVIGALCMALYAGMKQASALSHAYLILAFPVALAVGILWVFIRKGILRDIKLVKEGLPPRNGIPHHGILFMVGVCFLLLFGCCVFQSWKLAAVEFGTLSARMWCFESLITLLLIAGVYLYTRVERGFSNQVEA